MTAQEVTRIIENVPAKPGQDYRSVAWELLGKLRNSQPVALSLRDKGMYPKKMLDGKPPVLFIVPLELLGASRGAFLFALQAYGSDVLTVKSISLHSLYRIGLSLRAAKALSSMLKTVLS